MAGERRDMINGGNSRPTPKRGQVKVAILFVSPEDEEESSYLLSPKGVEEVISDGDADKGDGGSGGGGSHIPVSTHYFPNPQLIHRLT
ncbi:hypothetical protein QYF36_014339 [Acer negundo]|nr:hypothetical protein QYF36_014339 [Acer negundo]